MWVKICGNTSLEDAEHAIRAGAWRMHLVSNPDLDRSRGAEETGNGHKMHAMCIGVELSTD